MYKRQDIYQQTINYVVSGQHPTL
ncbi:hypothetical protein [Escherichia coli]